MPSPSRRTKLPVSAVQNPLETYLRDINATSLLTAEDERRLGTAVGLGDTAARDHMIRANLRLVVNIARGYGNRGLPLPECGRWGSIAAAEVISHFGARPQADLAALVGGKSGGVAAALG